MNTSKRMRVAILLVMIVIALPGAAQSTGKESGPRRIKTVYVIPSSHWDFGFIVPPEEILPRLKPHIDEVIANCKADPEFRWTIESVWQIRAWLDRTNDPKLVADFVDLVKKGQIQVSAVWGSTHTEFMGAEQMNRLAYDVKDLERRFGISTDFAMMNDVPGFTQRLPQVLARSGVKYFLNGSNTPFGGGTSLYPGKIPFYWSSPDGSRVLMWQTQGTNGGYTETIADYFLDPVASDPYQPKEFIPFYPKEWKGLPPLEIMQRGMDKLLKQYEKAGYPYDAVLLMYLHDFIPSSWERDQLLPNVRAWNAAGKLPKIMVATPDEFFRYMESKYGADLATRAGDWSGLWAETKTNSPAMSAMARWAHEHTPAAEMIWTLASFRQEPRYPHSDFEHVRFNLLKYDEHSGAGQFGWPKVMSRAEVEQQNLEYAQYTNSAQNDVNALLNSGLQQLLSQKRDPAARNSVAVFNPSSWERSGVVRIKAPDGASIRDLAAKKPVFVQRVSPVEIEFVAEAVPPVGYRTYVIEQGSTPAAGLDPSSATEIESPHYRVKVRASDGQIASIVDKQLKRELVDSQAANSPNQLVRWVMMRNLPQSFGKAIVERERGPLAEQLIIRRPGTYWPETRITLPLYEKSIRVEDTLNRSLMPFVADPGAGEMYGFAFPFRFTGSSQLWVDNGTGFYRFPNDLLPGARRDAAVAQQTVVMESVGDPDPYHVVLSQRESFFDYVTTWPGENGGPGAFVNEIRPAAIRKTDQGDTRDLGIVKFDTSEPGLGPEYHYTFTIASAAGPFNPVAAYRQGTELNISLIPVQLPDGIGPAEATGWYFSLSAPNVVILAFKPSVDGNPDHYTLRLQEIAGQNTEFKMSTRLGLAAVEETSLTEDKVLGAITSLAHLTIAPHQTLTLRLTIPHDKNDRQAR